ncbi:hypothetical protein BOTBODRAFT_27305 [Botryobasidium botryosum FD-172 SS1]|uniref:Uncharacterized protein n=1 Tax=Botryobasidium botryosum (strain FD-172 SS1) TaxID=930990 RepID=A0A067MVX7_BOTB1|nr:hypothetical protein BOTBODRAFT_27305 [Botryobasidium botryosum FD-172 SS1]
MFPMDIAYTPDTSTTSGRRRSHGHSSPPLSPIRALQVRFPGSASPPPMRDPILPPSPPVITVSPPGSPRAPRRSNTFSSGNTMTTTSTSTSASARPPSPPQTHNSASKTGLSSIREHRDPTSPHRTSLAAMERPPVHHLSSTATQRPAYHSPPSPSNNRRRSSGSHPSRRRPPPIQSRSRRSDPNDAPKDDYLDDPSAYGLGLGMPEEVSQSDPVLEAQVRAAQRRAEARGQLPSSSRHDSRPKGTRKSTSLTSSPPQSLPQLFSPFQTPVASPLASPPRSPPTASPPPLRALLPMSPNYRTLAISSESFISPSAPDFSSTDDQLPRIERDKVKVSSLISDLASLGKERSARRKGKEREVSWSSLHTRDTTVTDEDVRLKEAEKRIQGYREMIKQGTKDRVQATKNQLERRYAHVFKALERGKAPPNPLEVVRWRRDVIKERRVGSRKTFDGYAHSRPRSPATSITPLDELLYSKKEADSLHWLPYLSAILQKNPPVTNRKEMREWHITAHAMDNYMRRSPAGASAGDSESALVHARDRPRSDAHSEKSSLRGTAGRVYAALSRRSADFRPKSPGHGGMTPSITSTSFVSESPSAGPASPTRAQTHANASASTHAQAMDKLPHLTIPSRESPGKSRYLFESPAASPLPSSASSPHHPPPLGSSTLPPHSGGINGVNSNSRLVDIFKRRHLPNMSDGEGSGRSSLSDHVIGLSPVNSDDGLYAGEWAASGGEYSPMASPRAAGMKHRSLAKVLGGGAGGGGGGGGGAGGRGEVSASEEDGRPRSPRTSQLARQWQALSQESVATSMYDRATMGSGYPTNTSLVDMKEMRAVVASAVSLQGREERETEEEMRKRRIESEEYARVEYENKEILSEQLRMQSDGALYTLQSVGRAVQSYAAAQEVLAVALDLEYEPIPADILDALSSFSTPASKEPGWQSVETAHALRLDRRAKLDRLIETLADPARLSPFTSPDIAHPDSHDAIKVSIQQLESEWIDVMVEMKNLRNIQDAICETMAEVRPLHGYVSDRVDTTYPELGRNAALSRQLAMEGQPTEILGLPPWARESLIFFSPVIQYTLEALGALIRFLGHPLWQRLHWSLQYAVLTPYYILKLLFDCSTFTFVLGHQLGHWLSQYGPVRISVLISLRLWKICVRWIIYRCWHIFLGVSGLCALWFVTILVS